VAPRSWSVETGAAALVLIPRIPVRHSDPAVADGSAGVVVSPGTKSFAVGIIENPATEGRET
jgi:hypothetical protein